MKITISGTIGSGKSTVAKMLSSKLNYKYYSTGNFMRQIAEKRNITLNELNKIADKDSSIDKELDDYQTNLGKKENNFVLESRLGFHFVPDSAKIFLECDEKTASERLLKSLKEGDSSRVKEGLQNNIDKIREDIKNRRKSENARYSNLYNLKQDNRSNFDLIIDTQKYLRRKHAIKYFYS